MFATLSMLTVLSNTKPAWAADQTLLLEVIVNRYATGRIGEFILRDGALYAKRKELEEVGLRVARSVQETTDGLVKVDDLPGVKIRIDPPTQTLDVTASSDRLMPEMLLASGGSPKGAVESAWGATLNYDVIGSVIAAIVCGVIAATKGRSALGGASLDCSSRS